jgi:hypothetical protein
MVWCQDIGCLAITFVLEPHGPCVGSQATMLWHVRVIWCSLIEIFGMLSVVLITHSVVQFQKYISFVWHVWSFGVLHMTHET